MNGCRIQGTSIAVDFWRWTPGIKSFFLTHLHGDHVAGLTSTWRHPIYCSPVTARLLADRKGVDEFMIIPLDEGQTHLIGYCPSHCKQNHGHTVISGAPGKCLRNQGFCDTMSVSVINANHCPGAVMFLFEGPFGKILHTGDFRFSPDMLGEGSLLSRHVGTINLLYLDNTYCSPKCSFPTREEALQQIIQIMEQHPDHEIVFGLRKLGKEQLLRDAALRLKEWINVPPEVYKVATDMNYPNVFKTVNPDLRVRAVYIEANFSALVRHVSKAKPTIFIVPTSLYQGGGNPFTNLPEVHVVPYSDHSSFLELVKFVSEMKPARILPIVVMDRANMNCFQHYLNKDQAILPALYGSLSGENSQSMRSESDRFFQHVPPPLTRKRLPLKKSERHARRLKRTFPKGVIYLMPDEDDHRLNGHTY